ncbi:hypothetical protein POX_f07463 [Penicillium oxalicum]|uniref:hypothetical protein n=1 Tax=Penicillium oxalicum TaxID=69781 RepID=UPI0020B6E671|nr:hypothetical protein POX_f07463 [Penicillium oxalicum]KAI2787104.1 hypothetical protein POX_f07463 [Penicillium oxalicum]
MTALAVPAVPAPGMGTTLEGLSSQPINSRRPAAPTLPSFELPPPPFGLASATGLKYQAQPQHPSQPPVSHPPTNVSVGNLLTPPATNQPTDHGSLSHSLPPSSGVSSDLSPAYWPGTTPYGAPGGGPGQWAPTAHTAYSGRNSFSPSSLHRSGSITSPPTTDGLTQSFEAPSMASFSQALPAPSSTLASGPHPVTLGLYQPSHTASTAQLPSNDPYNTKAHSMYASPGQHTGYSPMYAGHNPLGGHGNPVMHPGARMPLQSPGGQSALSYPRQPWPSYSLPAMSGPIMSNVHSPNSPMSMMGGMQSGILPGFHSGHLASTQHLYGAHPAPIMACLVPWPIAHSNAINAPKVSIAITISSATRESIWR